MQVCNSSKTVLLLLVDSLFGDTSSLKQVATNVSWQASFCPRSLPDYRKHHYLTYFWFVRYWHYTWTKKTVAFTGRAWFYQNHVFVGSYKDADGCEADFPHRGSVIKLILSDQFQSWTLSVTHLHFTACIMLRQLKFWWEVRILDRAANVHFHSYQCFQVFLFIIHKPKTIQNTSVVFD